MKKEYIVELREEEADELMEEHWVGELVLCKDCVKRRLCCIRRTDDPEWFCGDGERDDENG